MLGKNWLGLDIGGANLKAATLDGWAEEIPFALWKYPEQLESLLDALKIRAPESANVAVTMTGELCDCFETKKDGVIHIVGAVEAAFSGARTLYWRTDGGWQDAQGANQTPYSLAASNWSALGQWIASKMVNEPTVLVDMGSTTTDVLYLVPGRVLAQGKDDASRLRSGELVYTGFTRSPVCSLVQDSVCAELFATTLDAHLIAGTLGERPERGDSADGRAWTVEWAHARMARMLGADICTSTRQERERLADAVISAQWSRIAHAIGKVVSFRGPAFHFILAGQGARWVGAMLKENFSPSGFSVSYLDEIWGEKLARVACAHAVALLAEVNFREA
jgi:probable H4MPT-linked C1 transfer pathway protein